MAEDAPGASGADPFTKGPFTPGFAPECMACPFGLAFFAMKNTKPEAMEHLMRAGFELFQAFKVIVEGYAERWEQADKLQHIPIS